MQKPQLFSRIATLIIAVGWINTVVVDDIKYPVSRVILTDQFSVLETHRSLTVDQVIKPNYAAQFRPNTKAQTNFGMSKSAFWFRIDLSMLVWQILYL